MMVAGKARFVEYEGLFNKRQIYRGSKSGQNSYHDNKAARPGLVCQFIRPVINQPTLGTIKTPRQCSQ